MGKTLIYIGIALIVVGLLVVVAEKMGLPRLPGDIVIKKENFTFYFPLMTCIVLSIVISLILYLINKLG